MVTTPRCPYCNAQGLNNLAAREVGYFSVIYCGQCGAIYGVVPLPQKQSCPSPAKAETEPPVQTQKRPSKKRPPEQPPSPRPEKHSPEAAPPQSDSIIAEIGNTDWSNKVPYNPQKIAAQMRMAGINRGTKYLRIATPDGPPDCTVCGTEMEKAHIPKKYRNGGRSVWICPNYRLCEQWEIVDE